jgi:hypothetical protein
LNVTRFLTAADGIAPALTGGFFLEHTVQYGRSAAYAGANFDGFTFAIFRASTAFHAGAFIGEHGTLVFKFEYCVRTNYRTHPAAVTEFFVIFQHYRIFKISHNVNFLFL